MRNCIWRSASTLALRSAIVFWMATAHSTAFTTLPNSARMPSPAVSMMRPPCSPIIGRTTAWCAFEVADGARFVRAHERAVAGDVGGEDGGQPALNLCVPGAVCRH